MHISYSSLSLWNKCSHWHKLQYIDKIPCDRGSVHTAFGNAVHETVKDLLLGTTKESEKTFQGYFKKFISELSEKQKNEIFSTDLKNLAKDMMKVGPGLCLRTLKQLEIDFPGYILISAEEQILEPIVDCGENDYEFKGFIDLVIKTPDGVYHIIDHKTTSWGWKAEKKSDKWTTYQLALYKHYYSLQADVDFDSIKTYFGLIKRTCKNESKKIEIFESKVGRKKVQNVLNIINNMIYNIDNKKSIKNRLSCEWCPYYKTEWCK